MTTGLRVGITGCGFIGRKREVALRDIDSVVGVVDTSAATAENLANELGAPTLASL